MPDDLYERGLKIRKEVMGEALTGAALDNADDFDREYQRYVTENAFGRLWSDETLSRKQRSLNNLCMLAALNRSNQFEAHFRAALRNGCSEDELKATLLQITGYVGFPAGSEAFRIAKKVLREEKAKSAPEA